MKDNLFTGVGRIFASAFHGVVDYCLSVSCIQYRWEIPGQYELFSF